MLMMTIAHITWLIQSEDSNSFLNGPNPASISLFSSSQNSRQL